MGIIVDTLKVFEADGFIADTCKPGHLAQFTFEEIEQCFTESDTPWEMMNYKSYATMAVFFSRNIPGYKRPRGLPWREALGLEALPKGILINGEKSEKGIDKEAMRHWRNMLKQVSTGKFTCSEEWVDYVAFRDWYVEQEVGEDAKIFPGLGHHYSKETARFDR